MSTFEKVIAAWRDNQLATNPPGPNDERDPFRFWRRRFEIAAWNQAAFEELHGNEPSA